MHGRHEAPSRVIARWLQEVGFLVRSRLCIHFELDTFDVEGFFEDSRSFPTRGPKSRYPSDESPAEVGFPTGSERVVRLLANAKRLARMWSLSLIAKGLVDGTPERGVLIMA